MENKKRKTRGCLDSQYLFYLFPVLRGGGGVSFHFLLCVKNVLVKFALLVTWYESYKHGGLDSDTTRGAQITSFGVSKFMSLLAVFLFK